MFGLLKVLDSFVNILYILNFNRKLWLHYEESVRKVSQSYEILVFQKTMVNKQTKKQGKTPHNKAETMFLDWITSVSLF